MLTFFFSLFGKPVDDFEAWAKVVMAELLVELVLVMVLVVTYGF